MSPVTKSEEPPVKKAKKLRVAIKQPEALDNRSKAPLHIMKEAFRYLTREQQQKMRLICSLWNRFIATHPSHLPQLFKLETLFCDWFAPGEWINVNRERHWPDLERPLKCCDHLEDLTRKMTGQRFIPALEADVQIVLQLQATPNSEWIYYYFLNEITEETARHALHLFSHIREAAFEGIHDWKTGAFLLGVHPDIAALFLPMRCRCMNFCVDPSMPSMPTLKSIAAAVRNMGILCYFGFVTTPPPPAQVKDALEKFSVDTRHLYNSLEIGTYCGRYVNENHHWVALFRMVIEFISKALKDSREMVPRIDFSLDDGAPGWPLLPFSDIQLVHEETNRVWISNWRRTTIKRTYEFNIGGTKTLKAELECGSPGTENEYVKHITFLID